MKKLIVCGAAIIAFSSCKSGWSSADKEKFVTTCTSAASGGMGAEKAKAYCECMLPKIEKKYPTAAEADKMNASDTSITAMARECLK